MQKQMRCDKCGQSISDNLLDLVELFDLEELFEHLMCDACLDAEDEMFEAEAAQA